MSKLTSAFIFALALVVGNVCQAQVTIDYGSLDGGMRFIDLETNRANQEVLFFVTGLDAAGGSDGFEFNLQIGDGGSDVGGTDTGPPFLGDIDLLDGTIWEGNGPSQQNVREFPLAKQSTVDTTSLVTADGLLATVAFDTTGIQDAATFNFFLTVGGSFDTVFFNGATEIDTTAPDGFLRIMVIPEPSSGLILSGMLFAGVFSRRRRA